MILLELADVWGWEHAIRGMRNPLNSWSRSDSHYCNSCHIEGLNCVLCNGDPVVKNNGNCYALGKDDRVLMRRLVKAGSSHRKFLRQIFVSVDITAPLYWWKEFDTYKVGTVANSCSTMHTIHRKEFELNDFSHEHLTSAAEATLSSVIERLNFARREFLKNRECSEFGMPSSKDYWWDMIQLLPSSYNQKRTVTMSYENLFNILECRSSHKLDEWRSFCDWILTLPYADILKEGV